MAVRVDASHRIGIGHVVRCLTLAKALRQRGGEVQFICRAHTGHQAALLQADGFEVALLPAPPKPPDITSENYSEWLGVSDQQDADETRQVLAKLFAEPLDWLVVDHYALDQAWERALRPCAQRIFVIDDLPQRVHDSDLLLDQGAFAGDAAAHAVRAPSAKLLLGPRYALLHPAYAQRRKVGREPTLAVAKVLLFFGGTDPANLTGAALQALSAPGLTHLKVDVVAGPNNPHREQLAAQVAARPGTALHSPRPHLADLMAQADLAVGGGGITTWERMCLGLPALVVSLAENQRPTCEMLALQRWVAYAGHFDDISPACLAQDLMALVHDTQRLNDLSQAGWLASDGLGAGRVAEALWPSTPADLTLRRARAEDAALYFFWVNDPAVRASAFEPATITWPVHQRWFAARLADPASRLYVLTAAGLPVGQIRFDGVRQAGLPVRVDYSLDALVRGRNWAAHLVAAGLVCLRSEGPVSLCAEVKAGNTASQAVFRKLGFTETAGPAGSRVFALEQTA
ncbi:MAG: UDP-2,4-diacetamido-2,4,6-trideoxy-beta-L-altropyranose hydrolase [Burkholderiaceae bacterium]